MNTIIKTTHKIHLLFFCVLLAFQACDIFAAPAEDPMRGIHVSDRVTTAAVMHAYKTYDVTILVRLTYAHAGLPTKVEVVRSSKLPLLDDCAVHNAQKFWSLDKDQAVPTVRVVPMKFRRI